MFSSGLFDKNASDLLNDYNIKKLSLENNMIDPFVDKLHTNGIISYGLSSYGYDARLAPEFKTFKAVKKKGLIIDPKSFSEEYIEDSEGDTCIIPPNGFVLARTIEYFKIPDNVLAICMGKSTYARCGIIVNVTPLEPGWEGHVTLELSNTTPIPAKVYANEGICQFLFFENKKCKTTYKSRAGKYQGQLGVTTPRIK